MANSSRRLGKIWSYASICTGLGIVALILSGCESGPTLPPAAVGSDKPASEYLIGPGDKLAIFVWRNPELSVSVPVRPDGRISLPLAENIVAIGKTPDTLAREIEEKLKKYISDPIVTVMVNDFSGPFAQQVRIIGEAVQPRALPYRANMTVLDAMIEVGGLTKYASGNRATLVRHVDSSQETYSIHLDSLINDGKIEDNVALKPGDIIIIPQRYF